MILKGNERRTAKKAVRIKTSKKKVKNRELPTERESLFMKGPEIDDQQYTPVAMLLNLLIDALKPASPSAGKSRIV